MNELFFILRPLTEEEVNFLEAKIGQKENIRVVFNNENFVSKAIRERGVKEELGEEKIKEVNQQSFHEVINFGHVKDTKNNSVLQKLSYKNCNCFWYYIRFLTITKYRAEKLKIETAKFVKQKYLSKNFDHIKVYTDSGPVQDIFKNYNITFKFPSSDGGKVNSPVLIKYFFIFFIRAFVGFFQLLGNKIFRKRKHHIITSPTLRQNILAIPELVEKDEDGHLFYLKEQCKRNREFLFLSEFPLPKMSSKLTIKWDTKTFSLDKGLKQLNFEIFFFLTLLNPFQLINCLKYYRKIKHIRAGFDNLSANQELIIKIIRSLTGILLYSYLREYAAVLFYRFFPNSRTVTCINEHGRNNKTIQEVGKRKHVTTIGIQHGAVYGYHPEYYFTNNDLEEDPIPDYTITWGEKWQKILTDECNYPASRTIVLGQLRTDCIPYLKKLSKKDVDYRLDNERLTFTYASQPLFSGEEELRKRLLMDFLYISNQHSNTQLIIKPHPHESIEFFKRFIPDSSLVIIYTGDLYKVLSVSDMVYTYYSTVGSESIYFNKDLLVPDYYDLDLANYIKDGIGFKIKTRSDLDKAISLYKQNGELIKPQKKEEYRRAYVYKIDGHTAKRYMDFIKSF